MRSVVQRLRPRFSPAMFVLLILAAAAVPASLRASQKSVVTALLPAPAWKLESEAKLSLPDFTRLGDRAAVDQELGVSAGYRRVYSMGNLQAAVVFEEAADPSSAYSLYTLSQTPGFRPVAGVELAAASAQSAVMTRGRYLIRIPKISGLAASQLRSLLIDIGGKSLSAQNRSSLPPMLPQRGLEPGSAKYVLGPQSAALAFPSFPAAMIGFEDGVEAHWGTYRSDGRSLTLLRIDYPTPQIAQARFEAMAKALGIGKAAQQLSTSPVGSVGQPPASPRIYGRREGSDALLVLNAPSSGAAAAFLDRFKTREIVTQAPQSPPDDFAWQMVQLVLANGEMVIILCFFAIFGGLLIYLTKRFIVKVFPGTGLIRPDEDLLIRLKIS